MNVFLETIIPMVIIAGLAAWILWLLFRRHQLNAQAHLQRSESFNRLLEKFGSSKELVDFLYTEQGQKFLAEPPGASSHPSVRLLRFVQAGVIFLAVGGAFLINAWGLQDETEIEYVRKMMDLFLWASLFLFVGIGLLLNAAISHLLLKKWGLSPKNSLGSDLEKR